MADIVVDMHIAECMLVLVKRYVHFRVNAKDIVEWMRRSHSGMHMCVCVCVFNALIKRNEHIICCLFVLLPDL